MLLTPYIDGYFTQKDKMRFSLHNVTLRGVVNHLCAFFFKTVIQRFGQYPDEVMSCQIFLPLNNVNNKQFKLSETLFKAALTASYQNVHLRHRKIVHFLPIKPVNWVK